MINFDDCAIENKTEHNRNWPYTPDYPYRILTVGSSGSGKTNVLLNLIVYLWWYKNGDTTLQQVEKQQNGFKKDLAAITSGNPMHKSGNQSSVIKKVKNLCNWRQKNHLFT